MRKRMGYSPSLVELLGPFMALVYDFIIGWIFSNAENKRMAAFEDGKWWTYGSVDYYAHHIGFKKRTFQRAVAELVKQDYLQVKHKGSKRELWFCLGSKIPDIPLDELPLQGKLFDVCRGSTLSKD